MTRAAPNRSARRWPWVALLAVAIVGALLAFGVWRGECIDAPGDSPAPSTCTSGPAIGWPGAWTILALCVALSCLAITRLLRRPTLRRRSYQDG